MLSDTPKLVIPEGWGVKGYYVPKKGDGFVSARTGLFVVADMDFNDQSPSVRLCFRKIESVDTELEEARKKFPVGSYFTIYGGCGTILKIGLVFRGVQSNSNDMYIFATDRLYYDVKNCTPFPIPRWRCCDSDKPKKTKNCFLRFKESLTPSHLDVYLDQIKGWERLHKGQAECYEWLDEGGAK